jgi:hypothetical protein
MVPRNVVLAVLGLTLVAAAPAKARRANHPEVAREAATESCEDCHAGATPAVVEAWRASKHGLIMVKCFVCHGSTGKDFTLAPASQRCDGCHPAAVASVTPKKGGPRSCFDCHASHSLSVDSAQNPHAR